VKNKVNDPSGPLLRRLREKRGEDQQKKKGVSSTRSRKAEEVTTERMYQQMRPKKKNELNIVAKAKQVEG